MNSKHELNLIENELIPIYETSTGEKVVNGRELWLGLKSKREFTTWIKKRLEECDALENKDYFSFDKIVKRENVGGTVRKEYIIKLDIAKEMAMLERNIIGKQYRRYLISIEEKYKEKSQLQVPFTEVVQSIAIISKDLNINDASKLFMYDKLYSSYGVSTEFLPKYESNDNREIRPSTELLKRINSNIKTAAFNQLLIKNGYLEERTRKSTKSDELRYFKALTEKGLQYGENLISPKNQREVQPYYYTDKFQELYDLVTVKEVILA